MKPILSGTVFSLGLLFSTLGHAEPNTYECKEEFNSNDCSVFCEARVKSAAETCAKNICEASSARAGRSGSCSITFSNSGHYENHYKYDGPNFYVGYAVARENQ